MHVDYWVLVFIEPTTLILVEMQSGKHSSTRNWIVGGIKPMVSQRLPWFWNPNEL